MFEFLRSIDLRPVEWSEATRRTGDGTPYVGAILNAAFEMAKAVIVLLTPDDEARLRPEWCSTDDEPHEATLTGQARPNVLFEAGMAMGRDEKSTILVELGELRPFSDIGGRHVVRLDDSTQRRQDLAQRLRAAGCQVNLDGTDWHHAGDFMAAIAASSVREPPSVERHSAQTETPASSSELSDSAVEMLRRISASPRKTIQHWPDGEGRIRIAIGLDDLDVGDARSVERNHGALKELIQKEFVRTSRDVRGERDYAISDRGYQWLDANPGPEAKPVSGPAMSEEAWELLRTAVRADARIECITTLGRTIIRVKGRAFDTTDARATATWMGALRELKRLSLVETRSGVVFSVTREGFDLVGSEEG